jgi:hypothetical protein
LHGLSQFVHSTINKSEILFELFCAQNNIKYKRIPTDEAKTPDFVIWLDATQVVVEVKQIDPNPDDLRTLRKPPEQWDESDLYDEMPGERVRLKIKSALPQLRRRAKKRYPAIVVLYDNVHLWPELADSYAVRVAMYGVETILITSNVAPEGGAEVIRRWYGSRRKVSPEYNTTLSAVAVLREEEDSATYLDVYHNIYARVPLLPDSFRLSSVKHYTLKAEPYGQFPDWAEV